MGAAELFVADRPTVPVTEGDVIEAAFRLCGMPGGTHRGVRQRVDCALRAAGPGVLQDDAAASYAVVHVATVWWMGMTA